MRDGRTPPPPRPPFAPLLALAGVLAWATVRAGERAEAPFDPDLLPSPPPESVEIRTFDRIERTEGPPLEGIILDGYDPAKSEIVRVRRGTVVLALRREEIRAVVPRRDAATAYENWLRWLRGLEAEARERARAEFALALWCRSPHPALGGEPPAAEKALEHLERAVELDPGLTAAYPYLLIEYAARRDIATAPLDVLDREARILLGALRAGFDHALLRLRLARILMERLGLPEAAAPHLEAVLTGAGTPGGLRREARGLLVRAYTAAGKNDRARALLEPLLTSEEPAERFEAHLGLGRLLAASPEEADRSAARNHLLAALEIDSRAFEVHLDLAALDYARGALEDAAARLQGFIEARPDDGPAMADLALVETRRGRFPRAAELLKTAASAPKAERPARLALARGFLADRGGDPRAAAKAYREALSLDPDDAATELLLGRALAVSGRVEEAKARLGALLERLHSRPIFAAANRILAHVATLLGDDAEAARRLVHAADAGPLDPILAERAGLALLRSGKAERGAEFLERSLAADPKRPAALIGLGHYWYGRRNFEKAREALDKARAALGVLPPGSQERLQLERYLRRAEEALHLVLDLEVWADRFEGPDSHEIDGWEVSALYGVDVERAGGALVFRGVQANAPHGETVARLLREAREKDFERVRARMRIETPKVRAGLRIEARGAGRGSGGGLAIVRLSGGALRLAWKVANGEWEVAGPAGQPLGGRWEEYRGDLQWPADGRFHTIEVRSRRLPEGGNAEAEVPVFDFFFDGEPLVRGVAISGFGGPRYEISLFVAGESLGANCAAAVDDFEIFRRRSGRRR